MDLPFTTEQFLNLFRDYNTAIWPAQVIAYLLGIAALVLVFRKEPVSGRVISAILALFWIWMGAVYHLLFFREINPAAILFGGFFILEGVLFLLVGVIKGKLHFAFRRDGYGYTGVVLIAYALVLYPLIGALLGHGYPYAPMFGVAPCPATIFTFGILLWTKKTVPVWLLLIPLFWSFLGFTAALNLGIREDIGLLVSGLLAITLIVYRNHHTRTPAPVA